MKASTLACDWGQFMEFMVVCREKNVKVVCIDKIEDASMITEKIEDYANRSQGRVILDRKGAEDEIGAAFIDEIMQNPDVAERVWNQNPTLIEKLMR